LFDVEYFRNGARWTRSYNAVIIVTYVLLSSVILNELELP